MERPDSLGYSSLSSSCDHGEVFDTFDHCGVNQNPFNVGSDVNREGQVSNTRDPMIASNEKELTPEDQNLREQLEEKDRRLKQLEFERGELLLTVGELEFEKHKEESERKRASAFHAIYKSGSSGMRSTLSKRSKENLPERTSIRQATEVETHNEGPFREEVQDADTTVPTVPATVTNAPDGEYQRLLHTIPKSLLIRDDSALKSWATQKFRIDNPQNAEDVLLQLHENGHIEANNLCPLRDFFKSIDRAHIVYAIDEFLEGNYSVLQDMDSTFSSPR